ncbi:MAG TPA: hypothetical protein VH143_30695 [Kofleriaceae bacterium]|nr:hypothetical protein [Kofleriaceae bacterium]
MRQILVCVLAVARAAAADPCKPAETVAVILSPANTALDPNEGVVVGLVPRTQPGQVAISDLAKWHFHGDAQAQITELAPGLAALRPLARSGSPVLEDAYGKRLLTLATQPALPLQHRRGPELKASAIVRGADGVTRVMLDEAPPRDVVAVVFYGDDVVANPLAAPLGWTRVTDHAAKSIALDPRGNCAWTLPEVGHSLALEYVNATDDHAVPKTFVVTAK